MRKMLVATIVALSLFLATSVAFAGGIQTVADGDGGGSNPIGIYIIRVPTWDANGNIYWWNCEYLVFDWGTIQNRCW